MNPQVVAQAACARWKVLSLFFQCGWPNAMLAWLVACVVAWSLLAVGSRFRAEGLWFRVSGAEFGDAYNGSGLGSFDGLLIVRLPEFAGFLNRPWS